VNGKQTILLLACPDDETFAWAKQTYLQSENDCKLTAKSCAESWLSAAPADLNNSQIILNVHTLERHFQKDYKEAESPL